MNRFKDLKVWQLAMEFVTLIYKLFNKFPKEERFGLCAQMSRSAVSIPSNIAEGAGRNSKKEFKHFLSIALGSAFELETQLIISKNLDYLNQTDLDAMLPKIQHIQNMISKLMNTIEVSKNIDTNT